ncbi:MAG: aquaporin, partial [Acidimicrobiia bacterium]
MTTKSRIFLAEIIGTMILVVGGPGTAIFWSGEGVFDAKVLAVSLAFGLSLMVAAYCIGSISGCHINPAVTIGLVVAGKTKAQDAVTYILGQIVGALLGVGIIAAILNGLDGALDKARAGGFAANGYGNDAIGAHSPGGFSLSAVAIAEIVATAIFVLVVIST